MRKILLFISFLSITAVFFSCNKSKTAQELMKEEKKAISRFLDTNDFNVLTTFPSDTVFGEKDFYRVENGVYIRIIDKGNRNIMATSGDQISVRYGTRLWFKSDVEFAGTEGALHGTQFTYGNYLTYTYPMGNGWLYPLLWIGDGGKVSLIISSEYQNANVSSSYEPEYIENMTYYILYKSE